MSFRIRRLNRRYTPVRRSSTPGCLIAFFLIAAAVLLLSFSDLRALAIQMTPGEFLPGGLPVEPSDAPGPEHRTSVLGASSPEPTSDQPGSTPAAPPTSRQPASPAATPTLPAGLYLSHSIPVSDMVFLSNDSLMRWDRRSNQTRLLAENVADFVLSANSQVSLLLKPLHITVNGLQAFDLDLLHLETDRVITLLAETPRPQQLALSASGAVGAYSIRTERTLVYLHDTASGEPPKIVGACEDAPGESCLSLAISPDGRTLAWSDGRGIWIFDPSNRKTRLVHDPHVEITDPEGQVSLYAANFHNLRWSADGRFLLLRTTPLESAVGWESVVDIRTGEMAHIPDSFTLGAEEARTEWFAAAQVVVIHAGDPARREPPFIHIWNVIATNPEILVSDRRFDLYSDDFPFSPDASKSIPAHQVDWVAPGPPGKLLLAVKLPDTAAVPVIFSLDLQLGKLAKIHTLPNNVVEVSWSPDGTGGLVSVRGGRFYFLPLPTGAAIDLQTIFNLQPQRFHWLVPAMPKKGES